MFKQIIFLAAIGAIAAEELVLTANTTTVKGGQPIKLTCEAKNFDPKDSPYFLDINIDDKPTSISQSSVNRTTGKRDPMGCLHKLPGFDPFLLHCEVKSNLKVELTLTPNKDDFTGVAQCVLQEQMGQYRKLESQKIKLGK